MKKVFFMMFSAVLLFAACEPKPELKVNVEGDWKFLEHVEGNAELNPQNQMMIKSIVSIFEDASISMKDGKISLESKGAGKRTGTYTIKNGKWDVSFGESGHLSLNVTNEKDNLIVLFNEGGAEETGKIVLTK